MKNLPMKSYNSLIAGIGALLEQGRRQAFYAVNTILVKYPKSETLSHQLSWSHYFELLKIDDDLERSFYEKQCIHEKWSNRELKRPKIPDSVWKIELLK